jgi:hypothetical protein
MRTRGFAVAAFAAAAGLTALLVPSADGPRAQPPAPPVSKVPADAHKAVRSVVSAHCAKCLNEGLAEGGVRLDSVPADLKSREAAALWRRAAEQVLLGQMPPKGQKPLPAELASLTELAAKTRREAGGRETLQTMLAGVLLKADAVFRTEIGTGTPDQHGRVRLAPREIALALAFALTDSLPDERLREAAASGRLSTADGVRREVRRMLDDPQADNPRILRFFQEYFEYPRVTQVFKDARGANAIFANERVWDADALVSSILREDRDVLRQLLTTDPVCVSPARPMRGNENQLRRYRTYYLPDFGLPEDWKWTDKQPFVPPVGRRSGILTHPAWLTAFSDNEKNQAVQRGHWIRTKLLGGTVPDVPIGVNAQFPDDPKLTLREKMHVTREAYCRKCHGRMDELGLPFEQFDDFGRHRTVERVLDPAAPARVAKNGKVFPAYQDKPLDTSGRISLTGDPELDGPVKDPYEMLQRLAKSRRVRQVFVRHAFRYWMGRNETLDDAPTLIDADKAYVETGGSFKALVASLLSSDSFLYRRLPDAR